MKKLLLLLVSSLMLNGCVGYVVSGGYGYYDTTYYPPPPICRPWYGQIVCTGNSMPMMAPIGGIWIGGQTGGGGRYHRK